jgi:8-oxo-dGTP pyrophosphatase MutT (NUDIX family)
MDFKTAVPFVAGIIERIHDGKLQVLIQTRMHANSNAAYNGTLEFAAGTLDKLYENVYEALAREIKEETGLLLKSVIDDSRTDILSTGNNDAIFGFRPFCCTQQLKFGRPWVGFIFRCEVEDGEPTSQEGETQKVHWEDAAKVKEIYEATPEKFFGLELPAWQYYFQEVEV